MIELIFDKKFKRIYRKWSTTYPELQDQFKKKIKLFISDPFHPSLKIHRLSGNLKGLWAISINREQRIVFDFENREKTKVLLIDIGKHKDVY